MSLNPLLQFHRRTPVYTKGVASKAGNISQHSGTVPPSDGEPCVDDKKGTKLELTTMPTTLLYYHKDSEEQHSYSRSVLSVSGQRPPSYPLSQLSFTDDSIVAPSRPWGRTISDWGRLDPDKRASTTSTKKVISSHRIPRMTVHQRNGETRESCFPSVSPSTKNHWPVMDNDSSSWDRNSRATSSSWPGEMEEAVTRKILQLWHAIESNIYGENDEKTSDPSMEECNQWRSQLIHLRIIGKGANSLSNVESSNEIGRSTSRRSGTMEDRYSEEIYIEDSNNETQDLSENSRQQRRLMEDEKDVFDQMLEYVCTKLKNEDVEKKDSLSKDLDEVLRITPAPTYSGRKWTNGRNKRDKADSRRTSGNENRSGFEKSVDAPDVISQVKDRLEGENDEIDEPDAPTVPRNKLGTVFNEKIVVSPVPFVVSTRESFTTLRTTPISFRAHNFKMSSQGLGRYMNSASTLNSGRRIAPSRISQIHSAWQAPVCPAVWPKNIKLAPIDPSRLPSSKNRSSIDSMAGLPHRNRNSLSPILPPIKPVTSANQRNNNIEGLEIQGKQMATRSPKKNLSKTGWDCSPKNSKNTRVAKSRTTNKR